MKNIITILLMLVTASACGKFGNVDTRLRPPGLPRPPETAPAVYKQGWNDGCESGISAYGNDIYKAQYSFKQDVRLMRNRTYYKAWNDALNYCRSWINRYLGDGLLDTGIAGPYDLRNRKVIEGVGMGIGVSGINTPGWYNDPFAGGIPGYNQNYFEGGDCDIFSFCNYSDWLGRDEDSQTDWLGRPKEYQTTAGQIGAR